MEKLEKIKQVQAVQMGKKIYLYAVTEKGNLLLSHDPEAKEWEVINVIFNK